MNDELDGLKSTATGVVDADVAAAADLRTLINTLCPDGVEWKTVGEVTDYEQPSKYIVKSTNYDDSFATPVLTAGKTFILGRTNDTTGIYNATKDNPVILFDDFTGAIQWVDFPFKVKSGAAKMITGKKILTRYLYFYMTNLNYTSDEHRRLWIGTYSNFRIPVPPLAVQAKIVQILNKFTELAKELAKEKQARRAQYEYYRDWLLDLTHPEGKQGKVWDLLRTLCPDGVKWKTVGELQKVDIIHTLTPSFKLKKDAYQEQGTTPIVSQDKELITGYCNTVDPKIPDGEYVCFGDHTERIKYLGTRFVQGADGLKIMSTNEATLLPKYYYYAIMSHYVCIGKYERHFKRLLETRIPVPPLAVQAEIVRILDQFSTLAEDITAGLPAEIAVRQTQYEYYRNQLLDFRDVSDQTQGQ